MGGMEDYIDSEVIDVSSSDEDPVLGSLHISDFHAGLFEADGEATQEQYFEDPFDDSDVTKWSHESKHFAVKLR